MPTFKYFNLYLTNDDEDRPIAYEKLKCFPTSDNPTLDETLMSYELYFYQRIDRQVRLGLFSDEEEPTTFVNTNVKSCQKFNDPQVSDTRTLNYIINHRSQFRYLIANVTEEEVEVTKNQLTIKIRIIDHMNGEWKTAQDDCFWFGHETRLAFDDIKFCNEVRKQNKVGIVSGIIGPMFAGKTTGLINQVEKLEQDGENVIVVTKFDNSHANNRYDHLFVTTHDKKLKYDKNVRAVKLLWELGELMTTRQNLTLAIEELHLYPDSQYFVAFAQALGINVIFSTIVADQWGNSIPTTRDTIASANHIERIYSTCVDCGDPNANYSWRFVWTSEYIKEKHNNANVEAIGGAEKYVPLCVNCYYPKMTEHLSPL